MSEKSNSSDILSGDLWANRSPHQETYDRLKALVPNMGSANTCEGELLRCISRIYYETYNNGGSNNRYAELECMRSILSSFEIDLFPDYPIFNFMNERETPSLDLSNDLFLHSLEKTCVSVILFIDSKNGEYHPIDFNGKNRSLENYYQNNKFREFYPGNTSGYSQKDPDEDDDYSLDSFRI